ncbi:hypothetical protein B0H14DRAFT_2626303 [Mycena olivaceomarginata]|nr:hypothetical protein B0H14DRAFT_2626303 [Mycena olivaceomarginata]
MAPQTRHEGKNSWCCIPASSTDSEGGAQGTSVPNLGSTGKPAMCAPIAGLLHRMSSAVRCTLHSGWASMHNPLGCARVDQDLTYVPLVHDPLGCARVDQDLTYVPLVRCALHLAGPESQIRNEGKKIWWGWADAISDMCMRRDIQMRRDGASKRMRWGEHVTRGRAGRSPEDQCGGTASAMCFLERKGNSGPLTPCCAKGKRRGPGHQSEV